MEIACEARDIYYERCQAETSDGNNDNRVWKRRPILVAASVGSYGAYLADGSEYRWVYLALETLQYLHCFDFIQASWLLYHQNLVVCNNMIIALLNIIT